jgi:hypothetical protein
MYSRAETQRNSEAERENVDSGRDRYGDRQIIERWRKKIA